MIKYETLQSGQMFFLAAGDTFIVKRKDPDGWLISCWWGNESGKNFYYTLNEIHFDEAEWYETFRTKKILTDFSLLQPAKQHKLLKAILSLDNE
jgi:hypothetical protein